jgi:hypothetical protein
VTWLKSRLPHSYGFYGDCDVHFMFSHYRALAQEIGFQPSIERDITAHTLPTYAFLRELRKHVAFHSLPAAIETLLIESTSRLGLLRYGILGWQKPE